MSSSTRSLPRFTSVGYDVANNADGEVIDFFHETSYENLDVPPSAARARPKFFVATGAYSHITSETLDSGLAMWEHASPPVFVFFPLIASDMSAVIGYFHARGMDDYHEPALHWLPLDRITDDATADAMGAMGADFLSAAGASTLLCASTRHLHASPLIYGPAGVGLRDVAKEWVEGGSSAPRRASKVPRKS